MDLSDLVGLKIIECDHQQDGWHCSYRLQGGYTLELVASGHGDMLEIVAGGDGSPQDAVGKTLASTEFEEGSSRIVLGFADGGDLELQAYGREEVCLIVRLD